MVKGIHFEFTETPFQDKPEKPYNLDPHTAVMSHKIEEFLQKNIIEKCEHTPGEIISPLFFRPKKSGDIRVIGNFKSTNKFIKYKKFKQATLKSTLDLVRPNAFMTSIDLSDAYFCVNVAPSDRKYLRFIWEGQLYQFVGAPQGIGCSPRLFCKLMKVPVSHLRQLGITLDNFIDDFIIISESFEECLKDTQSTIILLQSLGYVINFDKSQLTPTQVIEHLGVNIDSVKMTVSVTEDKCEKLINLGHSILQNKNITIRDVARLVGTMISYLPGVELGQLHYRNLERCRNKALQIHKGNFEGNILLSQEAKNDISWWISNIKTQFSFLLHPKPSMIITTDSCQTMWGAHISNKETGGLWDARDRLCHINYLESKAIELGLKSLCKKCVNCHIRIQTDSSTSMTYINKKGGLKSVKCDIVAKRIWAWAIEKNCHLSAVHVRGIFNSADKISRTQNNSSEWELNQHTFLKLLTFFHCQPTIDLFASRINFKLRRYVSYQADPGAILTNALMHDFGQEIFWAFPPFNLITRFLRKVELDSLEGLIVVPNWSTQPFFPLLTKLLVDVPVSLRWHNNLLSNPAREAHPLGKRLHLICCHISGKSSQRRAFLQKLQTLSLKDGPLRPSPNIRIILKNGHIFASNKTKIPLARI